jgi:hypothetical protein
MKTLLLLLLPALLFISCNTPEPAGNGSKNEPAVFRDSSQNLPAALTENTSTASAVNPSSPADEFNSPEGIILKEFDGGGEYEYTFCKDGFLRLDYSPHEYKTGTWEMKGDSVLLNYTLVRGQKGVGKPLPEPEGVPGNYVDRYEKYEDFKKKVGEQEVLSWSEIKEFLKKDPSFPYMIITRNANCQGQNKTGAD